MGLKLANNALSRLSAGISPTDTTIVLVPGGGASFPTLGAGDYFPATIVKADGTLEIVKVTARAADVLTVARAQENTTAKSFNAGDRIELRLTAGTYEAQFQSQEDQLENHEERISSQNNLRTSGVLTPSEAWEDVPALHTDNELLDDEINIHAQKLLNRFAYLLGQNGAKKIGYRETNVYAALDYIIDVRAMGVVGDGLIASAAANLAKLNNAVSAHGSGIYRFPWSPNGDNTFIISDSWNIKDLNDVQVFIDPGVTLKTVSATTYGHVVCFGAGSIIGGSSTGRVNNVGVTGGGRVVSSGSSGQDNAVGFLRCNNWYVIGMDLPSSDRKAITAQVNDPSGDSSKFNGNGWVLNNKIGTTGHHAITVEGGCDGTIFIDGNTAEIAGLDFLHFAGSTSPSVSIKRVVLGTNVCKTAGGKGLYAFKVDNILDERTICEISAERGVDVSTCGNVYLGSRVKSSGSWGARVSSCTGDISIGDGFKCATSAASYSALDLSNNTYDATISSAIVGDGGGTFALTATGKSATLHGTTLRPGSSGLVSGVYPTGRLFADGVYSEASGGVIYKVPGGSVLIPANTATPDVSGGTVFKTQNSVSTNITNFINGRDGQEITITFNDTVTTIQDNANIKLAGSTTYTPTAGNDTITFVRAFGVWLEKCRSDN